MVTPFTADTFNTLTIGEIEHWLNQDNNTLSCYGITRFELLERKQILEATNLSVNRNHKLINQLHSMIRFLEANPDLPRCEVNSLYCWPQSEEDAIRVAQQFSLPVAFETETDVFYSRSMFNGCNFTVSAIKPCY